MKKILFFWWDHKEQPDFEAINRGIKAVFNGMNQPFLIDIDTNSDTYAIAICSDGVNPETLNKFYWDHETAGHDNWFEYPDKPPTTYEIK